jgi:hypothetical protein
VRFLKRNEPITNRRRAYVTGYTRRVVICLLSGLIVYLSPNLSLADPTKWTEGEEEPGTKLFYVQDMTKRTSIAILDCYVISNRSMIGLEVSINDLLSRRIDDQTEYWLNVYFIRRNSERSEPSQLYAYASFEYSEFQYFFASKTLMNPHLEAEFKSLSVCKRPIGGEPTEKCISFTTRGRQNALKLTCQKAH